jgi:hypothetical protein
MLRCLLVCYFAKRLLLPIVTILSIQSASARDFFGNIGHEVGSCLSGGCDVVWEVNKRIDAGVALNTSPVKASPASRDSVSSSRAICSTPCEVEN